MLSKIITKIISLLKKILPLQKTLNHKFLNKNQVTNLEIVINSLKNRGYQPTNIIDVGCFEGLWTKQVISIYDNSYYYLFDADNTNSAILDKLIKIHPKVKYKIKLLSNIVKEYDFYKMKSGSSIFEENTSFSRECIQLKSSTLAAELDKEIFKSRDNLIKIDAQGSEINILKGLGNYINNFEVVILEVSLHEYNKNAPLFDEVFNYMYSQEFKLYDIFDLKRHGNNKSFLFQYDCIFIKKNSNLFKVKF